MRTSTYLIEREIRISEDLGKITLHYMYVLLVHWLHTLFFFFSSFFFWALGRQKKKKREHEKRVIWSSQPISWWTRSQTF
jgi:cbb3-type cytochrome oxidase subunit 3